MENASRYDANNLLFARSFSLQEFMRYSVIINRKVRSGQICAIFACYVTMHAGTHAAFILRIWWRDPWILDSHKMLNIEE